MVAAAAAACPSACGGGGGPCFVSLRLLLAMCVCERLARQGDNKCCLWPDSGGQSVWRGEDEDEARATLKLNATLAGEICRFCTQNGRRLGWTLCSGQAALLLRWSSNAPVFSAELWNGHGVHLARGLNAARTWQVFSRLLSISLSPPHLPSTRSTNTCFR